MDNVGGVGQSKRIVVIFYVLAAVALGMFLKTVLDAVFSNVGVNDAEIVFGWSLSDVIGFVVAFATAIIVWRIPRIQQVSLEVALELQRVTWPSMRETRAATVAVIVASFVAAAILGVFDALWRYLSMAVLGAS
jgi:preprotein translocase subunit SecE